MVSETERLRESLDGRGVVWNGARIHPNGYKPRYLDTTWKANGLTWVFEEDCDTSSATLKCGGIDHEQVVALTVGPNMDLLFPYGKEFVRADVYRTTMVEYAEWIHDAAALIEELWRNLTLIHWNNPKLALRQDVYDRLRERVEEFTNVDD